MKYFIAIAMVLASLSVAYAGGNEGNYRASVRFQDHFNVGY